MATMQALFLRILFIGVYFFIGLGHHPISVGAAVYQVSAARDIRLSIVAIASRELGVKEATGKNDGQRVEEYLAYTHLEKGHEWCAAFVSWCYGQAGRTAPRTPWSPALFPKARTCYVSSRASAATVPAQPADLFAIYGHSAKRINHVGLVKSIDGNYVVTIEGNTSNSVRSLRRHIRSVYAFSNWLDD